MHHQSTFENYNYYPKLFFLKSKLLQSITKKHVAYRKFYKLRGEKWNKHFDTKSNKTWFKTKMKKPNHIKIQNFTLISKIKKSISKFITNQNWNEIKEIKDKIIEIEKYICKFYYIKIAQIN